MCEVCVARHFDRDRSSAGVTVRWASNVTRLCFLPDGHLNGSVLQEWHMVPYVKL
jgi:hypothetical protein